MHPVTFSESNVVFAKNQPEYLPLPVHLDFTTGIVTSCWKLSWKDLIRLIFTRRVWFQQYTFNHPLQPQRPRTDYPFITNSLTKETELKD